jgi:hypothetical protein
MTAVADMTLRGKVRGGVVVLEPGPSLSEGTDVEVHPLPHIQEKRQLADRPSLRDLRPVSVGVVLRPLTGEEDLLDEMLSDDRH